MGLSEYIESQEKSLAKANKELFNNDMEFIIMSFNRNLGKKYININCAYNDSKFDFTIKTTIDQLEDKKEVLLKHLNTILDIINKGHADIKDVAFKNYNSVYNLDKIEILDIDR